MPHPAGMTLPGKKVNLINGIDNEICFRHILKFAIGPIIIPGKTSGTGLMKAQMIQQAKILSITAYITPRKGVMEERFHRDAGYIQV